MASKHFIGVVYRGYVGYNIGVRLGWWKRKWKLLCRILGLASTEIGQALKQPE